EPSERGELEITTVNTVYLNRRRLYVERLGRGFAWLDTGTHESLMDAGDFVKTLQHRQGLRIACLEEIGYLLGWIGTEDLLRRADALGGTNYADYLRQVAQEKL
ncbi:MAG: sugar phosphate nucleotidyltransferase, partial [Verrucomicrobiota bacterium]